VSTERVIIVCGGRDFVPTAPAHAYAWLCSWLTYCRATIVREGGALGGDRFGRERAVALGIDVDTMEADWKRHGRRAGPKRNQAMLDKEPRPIGVLAFPGGSGTADMVRRAKKAGIPVREYEPPKSDYTPPDTYELPF
jgi:hypothetical protein